MSERRLIRMFERYGARFFRALPSRERPIRRYER